MMDTLTRQNGPQPVAQAAATLQERLKRMNTSAPTASQPRNWPGMNDGWPEDCASYYDGRPYCLTCLGMRYIWMPPEDPDQIVGKYRPCPSCSGDALQKAHYERQTRMLKAIGRYQQAVSSSRTFENYQTQGKPESVLLAFRSALTFARDPKGFLVFHGPSGTGKSHLAAAICNHQKAQPENKRLLTLFIVAPDLLDMLRAAYAKGEYDELLDLCMNIDILLLDDLGTEKSTEWADEKLFQIINHRYNHRLPLFVATNCALADLEPRIYSRLSDDDLSVRVNVMAPDHRQRLSNPGAIAW